MKTSFFVFFYLLCISSSLIAQASDSLWDQERISNATVLLYQQVNDTSASTGSGTLINYDSTYFLLTASHVAKEMRHNAKLIFRLDRDKPGIVDFLSLIKGDTLIWQNHPIADISIIQLTPKNGEVKDRITKYSFPIRQISFQKDLPERETDLTFLGFPVVDLNMEYFSPLIFSGYRSSGFITQRRADTNTKCSFFFLNVPSIQGCSGSGVFSSVKKAMYFGSDKTFMIGIMHGTQSDNTGGKMAEVTPTFYILDFFK